jgi:hypothetical protein
LKLAQIIDEIMQMKTEAVNPYFKLTLSISILPI